MKRNNSLSTLFLAFWIGGLIGLLIRRHRERQLRRVPPPVIKPPPVIPPPLLHNENGLPPWHWNWPAATGVMGANQRRKMSRQQPAATAV